MIELFTSRLEYFLKTASEESLVSAAHKIGITQPALSHSIQQLESELGVKLFERSRRGIKLTPQGQGLYANLAGQRFKLQELVLSSVRQMKKPVLRIGCVGHIATKYFLDALEERRKDLPNVHLFTSTSLECTERVLDKSLEFAFVTWSDKPRRVKSIFVVEEPLAVIGLRKKFSEIERLKDPNELRRYPWVSLPKPQRDWTEQFELDQPGYLVRDVRALRTVLFRGLAIGYVQLTMFSKEELKRFSIGTVTPFKYSRPGIYAIHRDEISSTSKKFMELLLSSFETQITKNLR